MYLSTITALATPGGKGGIGIIKISGESSVSIASQIFRKAGGEDTGDSNRFESNLGGFLTRLHGNIETSTYETFEEQVKEIRRALSEFKDLLVNLEVSIQ